MSDKAATSWDEPPRFTYGDYLQWMGDERWELIEGKAHCLSHPEHLCVFSRPSPAHQMVLGALMRQLRAPREQRRWQALAAPVDVRLSEDTEDDGEGERLTVQPDILIVRNPEQIGERRVYGAPDFIAEILSPATTARDRVLKVELYEKHGVRE
jgi:Uma2 family endonuclease